VVGPSTWNSSSASLRDHSLTPSFLCRQLKTFLFGKAYTSLARHAHVYYLLLECANITTSYITRQHIIYKRHCHCDPDCDIDTIQIVIESVYTHFPLALYCHSHQRVRGVYNERSFSFFIFISVVRKDSWDYLVATQSVYC